MLKTLILCGFKSFADRTEFHFARGITGIVGPNGSGKSNVVDAVKWVLGEQSAKSLRGGEMTDVIFNGSASRRSLGLAEVTMVFDNASRALATEADEVQITRRVYRSGEGEYLINGAICRLKDIKQLFLGSGAGTDAYCIIEQGRVDVLLQASTKERRTIFEEAAGISRFKAKKIETLRRLERSDQNVQRLKDIIDEVESQLRSVKLQAAKAQRYQEYSERLKHLRLTLGLREYRQVAGSLAEETAALDALRSHLSEQREQAAAAESELARLEEELQRGDEAARLQEGRLTAARQHIAAEEATLTHERGLTDDLDATLARGRVQLAELDARIADLDRAAARVADELAEAEAQSEEQRRGVHLVQDELQRVVLRVDLLKKQTKADEDALFERNHELTRLRNDVLATKVRLDGKTQERERIARGGEQAAESLASVDGELQGLEQADETLQARLAEARQRLAGQREERERLRLASEETSAFAAELRARRSGVGSRIEILEGLERSHEGLGVGVREALALVEAEAWGSVVGMVADLLTVRREYAPLIDLALGERAQRFVVRDATALHEALNRRGAPFSGRVSFLYLSYKSYESPQSLEPPEGEGIVALASTLATCEGDELAGLPRQLLGRTLIVRDLETARGVLASGEGYRCVTLDGEVLEPDASLTVGAHHAEAGILSRKSELRELRFQATALDAEIAEVETELGRLRDRVAALDGTAAALQRDVDALGEQSADLRARIVQHRQKREDLHEKLALSRSELSALESDMETLRQSWERSRDLAERAETQLRELLTRIEADKRELVEREAGRDQLQGRFTEAKVALGKGEERLSALRQRHRESAVDLEQRRRERGQTDADVATAAARLAESQLAMLRASAALAVAYLDKEDAERLLSEATATRDATRAARTALATRTQAARGAWQEQQERAHAREMQVSELTFKRDLLVGRLREDYGIDLAELAATTAEQEDLDPAQSEQEIDELRKKLTKLGAVNMDALEELKQVEARAAALHAQYDDLASAKRQLEEIIGKINEDSRKLFTETFAAIRTNFQELFRKLFGGGMADIILEDESDILESGIEINARPPGKELRSIQLMSGGEKTMTAVALLLAIFRSKPSPFCILDEVDAALDEANISRYAAVLRDFLDRSHFIIVTHSKRTMATCDVLYGVTMQESGISKRVAVQFEDYPDEARGVESEEAPALGAFGGK